MKKLIISRQAPLVGGNRTEHTICATGDCCVGDEVSFIQQAVAKSMRGYVYFGDKRTVVGKIVKESYGAKKQQHTFTILLEVDLPEIRSEIPRGHTAVKPARKAGEKLLIKGRNLYRNGVMRRPWPKEVDRLQAVAEKHARGAMAREMRELRKRVYWY